MCVEVARAKNILAALVTEQAIPRSLPMTVQLSDAIPFAIFGSTCITCMFGKKWTRVDTVDARKETHACFPTYVATTATTSTSPEDDNFHSKS